MAHLYVPPVIASDAEPAEAHVLMDILSEPGVTGWSFGLCADPIAISITAISMGSATAAANDGDGPYFRSTEIFADGCTVGVIVEDLGFFPLPPSVGLELEILTIEASATGPFATTLEFCDTLGSPPVPVVVASGGAVSVPQTTDGVLEIRERRFIRADANGDLAVDLADPLFAGGWLFGGGEAPGCLAAADSNGDQQIDVADMVHTLSYLFQGGASPAVPFPDCGPEPAPALGCAEPTACP